MELNYTGCLDSVAQLAATIQEAADSRVSSQVINSGSRKFPLIQQHLIAAMAKRMGTALRKIYS
jgi:hemoglobin-like flavoprotein